MTSLLKNDKIGKVLIKKRLVDRETIEKSLRIANNTQQPLESVLLENKCISKEKLIYIKNSMMLQKDIDLPGIELKRKLGEGGMGSVYQALQTSLNRMVAIKILDTDLSKDINFAKRFLLEARILAKLNHPNIVKAMDFKESKGLYYFLMEYIPGQTLKDIVAKEGPLPLDVAITILMQMAEAIQYASDKRMVHRDIKPDNIIIYDNNKAKLCDLGLARWKSAKLSLTSKGTIIGTPHYLSPEQAQGAMEIDVRSDIYSLGATFFFMLTGKPPYEGDRDTVIHFRHIYDPPPAITSVDNSLPVWLDKFFAVVMAKDIEKRTSSPKELMKTVQKFTKYAISKRGKTIAIRRMPQAAKENSNKKSLDIENTPTPVPENTKITPKRSSSPTTKRVRKKRAIRRQQTSQPTPPPVEPPKKRGNLLLFVFFFMVIIVIGAFLIFEKQILEMIYSVIK